jgi:hypothetical protein
MIVIDFELWGYTSQSITSLGLIVIDNQGQTQGLQSKRLLADYRVRAYRKGTTVKDVLAGAKPIREGMVYSHPKDAMPVWNLMLKALIALGYDK